MTLGKVLFRKEDINAFAGIQILYPLYQFVYHIYEYL